MMLYLEAHFQIPIFERRPGCLQKCAIPNARPWFLTPPPGTTLLKLGHVQYLAYSLCI
jgi:hypothetical protein